MRQRRTWGPAAAHDAVAIQVNLSAMTPDPRPPRILWKVGIGRSVEQPDTLKANGEEVAEDQGAQDCHDINRDAKWCLLV